jgi:FkbM family methyltransferase
MSFTGTLCKCVCLPMIVKLSDCPPPAFDVDALQHQSILWRFLLMMYFLNRPEYLFRPLNLFRRLLLRQLWRRREVVVRLRNGYQIAVREGEFIGNNIINTRCHDAPLGEFLWRLIRKGDTCMDVGANIGFVTLIMAAKCTPSGRCISFEADPSLFDQLVENISRNEISHITPVNAAVSDNNGLISFIKAGESNMGLGRVVIQPTSSSVQIPAVRLDNYFARLDFVRVLKIDVEGYELQVLKGMSAALEAKKVENVVFEEHGGHGAESIEFLHKFGYTIFRLERMLRGPRLVVPDIDVIKDLEPNFVATLDPSGLHDLINEPGWHIF